MARRTALHARCLVGLLAVVLALGCQERAETATLLAPGPRAMRLELRDPERMQCRSRIASLLGEPSQPGDPAFDAARAEILGRARAEPLVLLRAPRAPADAELAPELRQARNAVAKLGPRARIGRLRSRFRSQPAALRALLLREGYLYSVDPHEALALVKAVTLGELFSEPVIWLERGAQRFRLERDRGNRRAGAYYRHSDGPLAGSPAALLLGDRVAAQPEKLGRPLHRDLRALSHATGFDRAAILHRSESTLIAELRFGPWRVRALLESQGAALRLGCLDAPRERRQQIRAWQDNDAPRRRALERLRQAVTDMKLERLPFDRPRGAEDHFSDGQLRPQWNAAYRRGQMGFSHDGKGYQVFDRQGRPWPPQMCVEFILESFERAAGTWYRPLGETRERVVGRLDFGALGIHNRAGVIAFGDFAKQHPEHFQHARFSADERIAFAERSRFFRFLLEHADRFSAGDVVAIQGPKRDGYVHQHGILIEDTDPVTGMPYALADHMKRPRRRTWEGIMAEAPRRSLLYHVRLDPDLLLRLDPGNDGR